MLLSGADLAFSILGLDSENISTESSSMSADQIPLDGNHSLEVRFRRSHSDDSLGISRQRDCSSVLGFSYQE
jgi:hypothetical protein